MSDPCDDTRQLSNPAGRGWQPVSRQRLPGEPPEPSSVDTFAALIEEPDSPRAVFTRALQVRFLDRLATCGNVRAACAAAGVSPHTAYKARRRCAALARLWDAALVLARPHVEAVLAARALDGVEVPILVRGEVVGYRRHYDARLLLAHLGRLDRTVEGASDAAEEAAGRFDELLAIHAGLEPDEALIEARVNDAGRDGMPGTLEELVELARAEALEAVREARAEAIEAGERFCGDEDGSGEDGYESWGEEGWDDEDCDHEDWGDPYVAQPLNEEEQAVLDEAEQGARARWAAWQDRVLAAVDEAAAGPTPSPSRKREGDGLCTMGEEGGGEGPGEAPGLGAGPTPSPSRKREGDGLGAMGEEGEHVDLPSRLREGPGVGQMRSQSPSEPCHPVTLAPLDQSHLDPASL